MELNGLNCRVLKKCERSGGSEHSNNVWFCSIPPVDLFRSRRSAKRWKWGTHSNDIWLAVCALLLFIKSSGFLLAQHLVQGGVRSPGNRPSLTLTFCQMPAGQERREREWVRGGECERERVWEREREGVWEREWVRGGGREKGRD